MKNATICGINLLIYEKLFALNEVILQQLWPFILIILISIMFWAVEFHLLIMFLLAKIVIIRNSKLNSVALLNAALHYFQSL